MTPPAPMTPELARVLAAVRETHDIVTLTIDAGGRPVCAPGQFNMLYAFGAGEVPISTSGDPARRDVHVHTVRAVGAATAALCALEPGDRVGVRGPFGAGWPLATLPPGSDLVVIAGGLGLAPLRPAVLQALADRARFGRIAVIAGARAPADLLWQGELAAWTARGDLDVVPTVDHADASWTGGVGVVTAALPGLGLSAGTAALVCGPEIMMQFAVRALRRLGLAEDRIFLAMERNMKCAIGWCGHCQLGPSFLCKDGPVLSYARLGRWLWLREG